jgi:hypothetical protein
MLETAAVPAWVDWIVRTVRADPRVTLAVVIGADHAAGAGPAFALYEALDRRLFPVQPDALARVDAGASLADVPRVRAVDVDAVRRHDLDVILHLGGARPDGPLLTAARHGVWGYRIGRDAPAAPALFWDLADAHPYSETTLEVLGGAPIYRSTGSTDAVSLHRNRVPAYWKSARFAIRRLDDLASGRWPPDVTAEPEPTATRGSPTPAQTARHVGTVARRVVRRKLHLARVQHQWFLGLRRRAGERLPQDDDAPWQVVVPPVDRSYADPFVTRHGEDTYVFLEVLPHARGTGELAVGRVESDGALTDVEPILPVVHHTSYPYVFRHGDGVYVIPEAGDVGRVELLACTDFPTRWEHVATLLDGVEAVDATVCRHDGLFWMWVAIAVPGGRLNDETFLYFSDRLEAGWTPHPRNPVVSDARRARPAGRPFVHAGRLIRPSQDCSGRYGRRVVFNVVERLTTEDYRERSVGALGPDWAPSANLAAHTYTFDGDWEATDGLRTFGRRLTRRRP